VKGGKKEGIEGGRGGGQGEREDVR